MLLIIAHIIYIIGAVCFAYFALDQIRVRTRWARWIFWVVVILLLTLGLDGLAEDFRLWAYHIPDHWLSFNRGFGLGLLLVLIVSGQLLGQKR
jgi:hypothetical protein